MNIKTILAIVLVAAVGYVAYDQLLAGKPSGAPAAESEVRAAVSGFATAMAKNDNKKAASFVAPGFSDPKIKKADFLKVVSLKRTKYTAQIMSVKVSGKLASVNYLRNEARGKGKPFSLKVIGETWTKDPKKPGGWLLHRLAENDKWFRSLTGPATAAEEKPKEKEDALADVRAE